ncbi:hypothetical protein EV426DRAFT_5481 [Tirmania nivea]|nr:hypothetical protein EV426DRAFT_5481 [Tirmania nivea]
MMAQSETTTLNIRALDTPIQLRAMANNIEVAIPEITASARNLLHAFVDTATQKVAEYRDINPRAVTLNKLRNRKICRNKASKKHLGNMARVMDRRMVDAGLKEIARKEAAAVAAEEAKIARKEEAAARKLAKEQAIQQKKAAREVQAVLEAQWKADYATAEAAWRIEQDQARLEHRKPPKKPVKPPRPRVVADDMEHGDEDLEGVGGTENEEVQTAEDLEATEDQDADELADMVRELEIAEFCNIVS